MALFGLAWVKDKQLGIVRQVCASLALFRRQRRSSTSVEFALVGSYYFLVLLFAIEGGIFYIKVDTLDLVTEQASRLIILNNVSTAPSTPAAFITDIANDSHGVLQSYNIAVSVQMAAPISGTVAKPVGGFQSLKTKFTAGTFQYVPGACQISTNETTNVVTTGACTGGCALTILGEADAGYVSTNLTTGVSTLNQTYTCSAGQDILVQVQYTDSTLTKLVSAFFGPVISTLAFQAEPSIT